MVFCESVLEDGFELVYNAIIIGLFNFIKIHCFNSTLRCKKMIRSIVTHPLLLLFLFAFLFNHAADVAHMSPTWHYLHSTAPFVRHTFRQLLVVMPQIETRCAAIAEKTSRVFAHQNGSSSSYDITPIMISIWSKYWSNSCTNTTLMSWFLATFTPFVQGTDIPRNMLW